MDLYGLAIEVAARAGLPTERAREIIKCVAEAIIDTVGRGEAVYIRGFGRFEPVERKAKKGRDFKTGRVIDIPARTTIKFKASDDAMGGKKNGAL